jgi:hypothetical protein
MFYYCLDKFKEGYKKKGKGKTKDKPRLSESEPEPPLKEEPEPQVSNSWGNPVLRIQDVYPGSEFFPSRIQGKKDSRFPDLHPL